MGDLHSMAKALEKKVKEIRVSYVEYENYIAYDFVDLSTWFIVNASQQYVFFHTSDRALAQQTCNSLYGIGFYTVKTSKTQKTKSKQEGGGLSCSGINSRKGFAANLRPS